MNTQDKNSEKLKFVSVNVNRKGLGLTRDRSNRQHRGFLSYMKKVNVGGII
jgi:hypothetical protein